MGEFVSMEEDWGLQAIVRGSTDYFDDPAISSFGSLNYIQNNNNDDDFHFTFPDLFEANYNSNDKVLVDELDELYKPFYPMFNSFSPQAPIITSSSSSDSFPEEVLKLKPENQEIEVIQKHTIPAKSAKAASPNKSNTAHAAKYKRKNQHKRVVVQVTADGLSSDLWAWRKYGQKPIKGSPYPRSYYRCSSLKGCLARKQVEQSCNDPGMFIITYSGEHSHNHPTRRSSLAGTNRHKFTTPKSPSSVNTSTIVATPKDSSCSPTSDISEEVVILQQPIKHEQEAEGISKDAEFVISDMILNDDFFVGLEELDALISTSTFYNCSTEHFR